MRKSAPSTKSKMPTLSKKPTLSGVLTKFMLVVFVAALIYTRRKCWDLEGRIAEVEAYVKTSVAMCKAEGEVGISGLRGEMDEKSEKLGSRLKTLDEKLDKGLSELTSEMGDLGELAKKIVAKEIEKHTGDGLGRVDHALDSGGARVIKHSEPLNKPETWLTKVNPNPYGVHIDSVKLLRPSFGEPGQCFPLKGSSGFVQIRLRKPIIPEAVTVEHVAKSVAYDRSSAPRDFRVYGWLFEPPIYTKSCVNGDKTLLNREKILLTEFRYDLDKSNAQTFNVLDSASSGDVDMIRFEFTSNHGSPSHTCIYRLRVHGHDPTHGYRSHFSAAN